MQVEHCDSHLIDVGTGVQKDYIAWAELVARVHVDKSIGGT